MIVTEQVHQTAQRPSAATVAAAAYAVLVLLGLMMGVLGGFQHSWYLRPFPISAVGWVVLLAMACYGAGYAMRGRLAALAPGVGWMAITLIWLGGSPEGDVIIANDPAGYVYLYGGLIAILAGVLLSPSGGGAWLLTQGPYGSRPQDLDPHPDRPYGSHTAQPDASQARPDPAHPQGEDRYRGPA
ncbi:DUF6113 family protein [Streptosporangium roseum]|uniref:Integral membrane protein n=1 Tax=Streptosporangium roseum (strain ATCC 12428 / DSM 43021 / JCM 3005 / KCTC 9067 / NCIMB 10171 / NRRL 2505 / NI 9100) TaxID=479432 RepID=D2B0T0_STRRD|nr:DUF6113 family protein [Streptosporangium roseum]ACZ91092.1 hypothetical protein Sros_8448 [Streptosporangium roseum DSM 43021]